MYEYSLRIHRCDKRVDADFACKIAELVKAQHEDITQIEFKIPDWKENFIYVTIRTTSFSYQTTRNRFFAFVREVASDMGFKYKEVSQY